KSTHISLLGSCVAQPCFWLIALRCNTKLILGKCRRQYHFYEYFNLKNYATLASLTKYNYWSYQSDVSRGKKNPRIRGVNCLCCNKKAPLFAGRGKEATRIKMPCALPDLRGSRT